MTASQSSKDRYPEAAQSAQSNTEFEADALIFIKLR